MSQKYVLSFDADVSQFCLAETTRLLAISFGSELLISLWNIGNEATPQQLFLVD